MSVMTNMSNYWFCVNASLETHEHRDRSKVPSSKYRSTRKQNEPWHNNKKTSQMLCETIDPCATGWREEQYLALTRQRPNISKSRMNNTWRGKRQYVNQKCTGYWKISSDYVRC